MDILWPKIRPKRGQKRQKRPKREQTDRKISQAETKEAKLVAKGGCGSALEWIWSTETRLGDLARIDED